MIAKVRVRCTDDRTAKKYTMKYSLRGWMYFVSGGYCFPNIPASGPGVEKDYEGLGSGIIEINSASVMTFYVPTVDGPKLKANGTYYAKAELDVSPLTLNIYTDAWTGYSRYRYTGPACP